MVKISKKYVSLLTNEPTGYLVKNYLMEGKITAKEYIEYFSGIELWGIANIKIVERLIREDFNILYYLYKGDVNYIQYTEEFLEKYTNSLNTNDSFQVVAKYIFYDMGEFERYINWLRKIDDVKRMTLYPKLWLEDGQTKYIAGKYLVENADVLNFSKYPLSYVDENLVVNSTMVEDYFREFKTIQLSKANANVGRDGLYKIINSKEDWNKLIVDPYYYKMCEELGVTYAVDSKYNLL